MGFDGSCDLFHPTICRNSLNYRECYNEDCTFTHLQGTARQEAPYSFNTNAVQSARNAGPRPGMNAYRYNSRQEVRPKSFKRKVSFSSKPNVTVYQGNEERDFQYQESDFPPLHNHSVQSQDDRINKLSSAIDSINQCLQYLMGHNSNSYNVPYSNGASNRQPCSNEPYGEAYATPTTNLQPNYHLPTTMTEAKNSS